MGKRVKIDYDKMKGEFSKIEIKNNSMRYDALVTSYMDLFNKVEEIVRESKILIEVEVQKGNREITLCCTDEVRSLIRKKQAIFKKMTSIRWNRSVVGEYREYLVK